LNEKLDQDDKRKCHKLTASASHEKAVGQQNENNTSNKQTAGKRSPGKRQNKHCKMPEKVNAV
jgi:hypothetical protein